MNKYLFSYYDYENPPFIEKIIARNYSECKDKIRDYLCNAYDIDISDTLSYEEFLEVMEKDFSIIIGEIRDLNEFT